MAAVKKKAVEDKAAKAPESNAFDSGLVAVTVGAGPIHHAGRRYAPGESLDVSPEVAAALVAAKLVTAAKG